MYNMFDHWLATQRTDLGRLNPTVRELFNGCGAVILSPADWHRRYGPVLNCGALGMYCHQDQLITVVDLTCDATDMSFSALHELTHWSGDKSRLNRPTVNNPRSTTSEREIHTEELTAQIGAHILSQRLGTHDRETADKYLQQYALVYPLADPYQARIDAEAAAAFLLSRLPASVKVAV